VEGKTQGTLTVFAEEIQLLPPDAKLPDLEDEHEGGDDNHEGEERKQEVDANSGSGSQAEVPKVIETENPGEASGGDQVSDADSEDHRSDPEKDDHPESTHDSTEEQSDSGGADD
jgi:hypothetical protein